MLTDPENREMEAIERQASLRGRRVVEIGSGDGRLTWRYAPLAALVACRDPDLEALLQASAGRPGGLQHVHLACARAQALDLRAGSFQLALFSWSL